ncbi:RNA polymerase sigma factor [Phycisphaerales bacterium AB-hyl4]|uniref:RNA polymerase sigma factor n=1 Tax=Natronomicrosphaera hydrolytica TaxID=3242702 RepID=A0ABV4UBT5_9BACT
MMDGEVAEEFARYQQNGDASSFGRLTQVLTPLIESIARHHLRDPHLIEDARQEVLIRLNVHAEAIYGNLPGWISTTTRAVCVDMIRRQAAQRRRVTHYAVEPRRCSDEALIAEAVRRRLDDALSELSPEVRELVRQRFLHGAPLRAVAKARRVSIATASRHVQAALAELRHAYESLGVDGIHSKAMLADVLVGSGWRNYIADHGLSHYTHRPLPGAGMISGAPQAGPDGWPRPIRVGVIVSYSSATRPNNLGKVMPIEQQVVWLPFLEDPRFELVGVVEPDTSDQPQIERVIRGYDLTAGLIDGTDLEALRTLDVIYLGWQGRIIPQVIRGIAEAVSEGVGCYNVGVTYTHRGDYHRIVREDPYLRALRLCDAVLGTYCTIDLGPRKGRHMVPMSHTVQQRHPALAGLEPGDKFNMGGCGLLLRPAEGVQVLATQDELVSHTCACDECLRFPMTTQKMPKHQILAGSYGRGRVFMNQSPEIQPLANHPNSRGSFLERVFTWLAEPRRPEAR